MSAADRGSLNSLSNELTPALLTPISHKEAVKNKTVDPSLNMISPTLIRDKGKSKYYTLKTYGGMEVQIHVFSTSALVGSGHPHVPADLPLVSTG